MLTHLLERPGENQSNLLRVFGPLLYDDASILGSVNYLRRPIKHVACRQNFVSRINYLEELRRMGQPSEGWHFPSLEAVCLTLEQVLHLCIISLREIALEQLGRETNPAMAQSVLRQIDYEVYNPGFVATLTSLRETRNRERNAVTIESQIIDYQLQRLRAAEILTAICRSSRLSEALSSVEIQNKAQSLVYSCQRSGNPGVALEVYGGFYYVVLISGGMGNWCIQHRDRKGPILLDMTEVTVRDWITAELRSMKWRACADAMEHFWETPSTESVLNLTEVALNEMKFALPEAEAQMAAFASQTHPTN